MIHIIWLIWYEAYDPGDPSCRNDSLKNGFLRNISFHKINTRITTENIEFIKVRKDSNVALLFTNGINDLKYLLELTGSQTDFGVPFINQSFMDRSVDWPLVLKKFREFQNLVGSSSSSHFEPLSPFSAKKPILSEIFPSIKSAERISSSATARN